MIQVFPKKDLNSPAAPTCYRAHYALSNTLKLTTTMHSYPYIRVRCNTFKPLYYVVYSTPI